MDTYTYTATITSDRPLTSEDVKALKTAFRVTRPSLAPTGSADPRITLNINLDSEEF